MTELKKGTISMTAAYIWWGIMPLYWSLLSNLSGAEITAYRVAFSFLTIFIILIISGKLDVFNVVRNRRNLLMVLFGSLMLGINWTVFIVSVSMGNVIEASMGYYITPIVSILLGVIFLKEKMNKWQSFALVFVSIGVIYYIFMVGRVPFVSLTLAVTFALYGLYKKKMKMTSIQSSSVETAVLFPISIAVLLIIGARNGIVFTQTGIGTDLLIIFSGAATMLPLILFSEGAKRIPMIRIGFLQYIAPSLMLVSSLILGGTISTHQLFSIALIWMGLAVYIFSIIKKGRLSYAGQDNT